MSVVPKGDFFSFLLFPHIIFLCLSAAITTRAELGSASALCRCRRQNLCNFQQPGVLHLAVAAGQAHGRCTELCQGLVVLNAGSKP